MVSVQLRFYEELSFFLPRACRKTRFQKTFPFRTTVKDLIESCGVPHTEVDLILVHGRSVPFEYRIQDGDDIAVYPVFETFDVSGLARLQARPLRRLRFVADVHLGKLTRNLRILGLDVAYPRDATDSRLLDIMRHEDRVLLTRDRGLLMVKTVQKGYYVRSDQPTRQTREVIRRFHLENSLRPFTRCPSCNGLTRPVDKAAIAHCLEPLTRRYYDRFTQCDTCGKIFWEGSHFQRLRAFVDEVRQGTPS